MPQITESNRDRTHELAVQYYDEEAATMLTLDSRMPCRDLAGAALRMSADCDDPQLFEPGLH